MENCFKSLFGLKMKKNIYSKREERKMFTVLVGDIFSRWHVKGLYIAELEKIVQELL